MRDVWSAALDLSNCLRSYADCQILQRALNPPLRGRDPIQVALNSIFAGFRYIEHQPLFLGDLLEAHPEDRDALERVDGGSQFLSAARRVAAVGFGVVGELRSEARLRSDAAPFQLAAPGWALADPRFAGVPWGLTENQPEDLRTRLLEFFGSQGPEEEGRVREVVAGLKRVVAESPECRSFAEAREALSPADKEALRSTYSLVSQSLDRPAVVEAVGPVWTSHIQYSDHVLRRMKAELPERAQSYSESFESLERLIQDVVMVLGALAVDSSNEPLPPCRRLEWRPKREHLYLALPNVPPIPREGTLLIVRYSDIGVTGVGLIKSVGFGTRGTSLRVRVLRDSVALADSLNARS